MKHTKLFIPIATALLTLAVPPAIFADDAAKAVADIVTEATIDGQFMARVIRGGLTEIKAAEIAIHETKREDVKSFAKTMAKDRADVNKNLTKLADRMKVKLPSDVGEHQPFIDGLKEKAKAKAADFDRTYIAATVASHEKSVAMFEKFTGETKNVELKAFAELTLPGLRTHLKHSKDLLATLGGASGTAAR